MNRPTRSDCDIPGPGGYDHDQFRRMPDSPDPEWLRQNMGTVRDFWLTIVS